MNDIVTELFDKCRIIINKLFLSPEILYYISGAFEDSQYISDIFSFAVPFSVIISLIYVILKSGKDGRLKNNFFPDFLFLQVIL